MEVMNNEVLGGMEKGKENEEVMTMMTYDKMREIIQASAVVVFSVGSECCMCPVVKHLLVSLGVAPTVMEVDSSVDIDAVFRRLTGDDTAGLLPAIFVGGKLLGGIEELIACHINGSLVPLLKEAGALWL
ncbi:glutaredoxin-C9-like [Silene latifolia]|uniref:glutaredoxin-C9-like n=1 Tax=Silene latifolia TaxID=37657 RepID=UPI003D77F0F8